jgi:hypothetical protein
MAPGKGARLYVLFRRWGLAHDSWPAWILRFRPKWSEALSHALAPGPGHHPADRRFGSPGVARGSAWAGTDTRQCQRCRHLWNPTPPTLSAQSAPRALRTTVAPALSGTGAPAASTASSAPAPSTTASTAAPVTHPAASANTNSAASAHPRRGPAEPQSHSIPIRTRLPATAKQPASGRLFRSSATWRQCQRRRRGDHQPDQRGPRFGNRRPAIERAAEQHDPDHRAR